MSSHNSRIINPIYFHVTAPAAAKAVRAKKQVMKGQTAKRQRKIRTKVTFRRPHTLQLKRRPVYPRKAVPSRNK
jgi:large subunit ribosomal protein L23Ae